MIKPAILAMTDEELRIKAAELSGRSLTVISTLLEREIDRIWNPVREIYHAWPLLESVYGRSGKIKGGAWVLSTVEGGRDVASACLMWKGQSGQKHRSLKVKVVRPRGEMAKAITQCWVCAMLGVSDE